MLADWDLSFYSLYSACCSSFYVLPIQTAAEMSQSTYHVKSLPILRRLILL